ncbi:MAG: hypothetical protein Q9160_005524 [Pyrenula sp. 1 TL-2023]
MLFTYDWQLAVMAIQAILGLALNAAAQTCSSDAIPHPQLPGAQIFDLSASPVQNYMITTMEDGDVLSANLTDLNFCEVNITYTHPGQNDELHVGIWLPLDGWNGRFQGTGGGGWYTGIEGNGVAWAVSEGYAAGYTDGGHSTNAAFVSPDYWGLVSPGNVNLYALQDFASVGLHDLAVLGKAVTASFYGMPPKYSYWNGCSTGGRQGLMMAQRYPEDYDGIIALSPAINWDSIIVLAYYGQFLMNQLQAYPPQCEFKAITAAAIAACDTLDGLKDDIISSPELCTFDPRNLTGSPTNCTSDGPRTISSAATSIVHGVWTNAVSSNGSILGGPLKGAPINKDATLASLSQATLLNTTCTTPETNCTGNPFSVLPDWLRIFLAKDPAFDPTKITHEQFDRFLHDSIDQYRSIIGTTDADLAPFRQAGGKMITWHGMADQLLSPNSPLSYYQRVVKMDPQAADFYRFFEAPGTAHCQRGSGPYPVDVQGAVVKWVEEGVVPERLRTEGTTVAGGTYSRELCPWPMKQRYTGGDPNKEESFNCVI